MICIVFKYKPRSSCTLGQPYDLLIRFFGNQKVLDIKEICSGFDPSGYSKLKRIAKEMDHRVLTNTKSWL